MTELPIPHPSHCAWPLSKLLSDQLGHGQEATHWQVGGGTDATCFRSSGETAGRTDGACAQQAIHFSKLPYELLQGLAGSWSLALPAGRGIETLGSRSPGPGEPAGQDLCGAAGHPSTRFKRQPGQLGRGPAAIPADRGTDKKKGKA